MDTAIRISDASPGPISVVPAPGLPISVTPVPVGPIVVEGVVSQLPGPPGPQGPPGDVSEDPGDFTLLFDNQLI